MKKRSAARPVGTLRGCFEEPVRPVWTRRPDVYALVIDGGEVQRVKNKDDSKVDWDLLKMTVTDETHPGCVVNFWCDKARKAGRMCTRPGDIVRLVRAFEPKKLATAATAAAASAAATAGNKAGNNSRYPRQLSAGDMAIVWRNGSFSAGEEEEEEEDDDSEGSTSAGSGGGGALRVIAWARSTWPALCVAPPPLPPPAAAHATGMAASTNSKAWSSKRASLGGVDPLTAVARPDRPIVPRFYSLRDLMGVGEGGGGGSDLTRSDAHSDSPACSFQGACLLRCRVKRLYLPPSATGLCRALQDSTAIEYHRHRRRLHGLDDKDDEEEEKTSSGRAGEEALRCVRGLLHQLVAAPIEEEKDGASLATTDQRSHALQSPAYRGWYLTVTDCDERQLRQIKDMPDCGEFLHYQEANPEISTQDFIDDILGDSEDTDSSDDDDDDDDDDDRGAGVPSGSKQSRRASNDKRSKKRRRSDNNDALPATPSTLELDVLVTCAATQELLGNTPASAALQAKGKTGGEGGSGDATALVDQAADHGASDHAMAAARTLSALHHEATITAASLADHSQQQDDDDGDESACSEVSIEEQQLSQQGLHCLVSSPVWVRLWVEHQADTSGCERINSRAFRFMTPGCVAPG